MALVIPSRPLIVLEGSQEDASPEKMLKFEAVLQQKLKSHNLQPANA